MEEPLVQSFVVLAAGVFALATVLRVVASRDLEAQIRVLEGQVVAWQATHDHQVASMDRRLLDLEECAARAEDESRMVSLQMERIAEAMRQRIGGDGGGKADGQHNREAVLTAGGGW